MIEALKKYKTILITIVVIIVAFWLFSTFFATKDRSGGVLTSQNVTAREGDNELLILLVNLRSITLDNGLFTDPAFRALVDFGQGLVPEPVGRQNPFIPVGSDDI